MKKRHYRHMSPQLAEQIRALYFDRSKKVRKQKDLARRFNVSQATISRIVSGITWA